MKNSLKFNLNKTNLPPLEIEEIKNFENFENYTEIAKENEILDFKINVFNVLSERIPSVFTLNFDSNLDFTFLAWLEEIVDHYKIPTKQVYTNLDIQFSGESERNVVIIYLNSMFSVVFSTSTLIFIFLPEYANTAMKLADVFLNQSKDYENEKKGKSDEYKNKIHVLTKSGTKSLPLDDFTISIEDNYNDDFLDINELIIKTLNTDKSKALILLHGKPGTGKTTYIRYLTRQIKKRIFFIPITFAHDITEADFMKFMTENPNSVFVIEDAEAIINSRDAGNMSINGLLNITDGILSDCLGIQIICTFNSDIRKIDDALLRKGRLTAMYEFTELKEDKATKLAKKLGLDTVYTEPVCLTDVYNTANDYHYYHGKSMNGFKTN